jgi:hypothetical protein
MKISNIFAMAIVPAIALVAPVASAQTQAQIYSTSTSLQFIGDGALAGNTCILTLDASIPSSPSPTATVLGGTNVPNPSAACTHILIKGGDVALGNYDPMGGLWGAGSAPITISNLAINTPLGSCLATMFGTAHNVAPVASTVFIDVPTQVTGCGPASAQLMSDPTTHLAP